MSNPRLSTLKHWFDARTDKEQRLLGVALVLLIILVFHQAYWAPSHRAIAQLENKVAAQAELQAFVSEQGAQAMRLRQAGSVTKFSGSLAQLVNQTAREHTLTVARVQPQNDSLLVWLDEAPFNSVVTWLNDLRDNGVMVTSVDLRASGAEGLVEARRVVIQP